MTNRVEDIIQDHHVNFLSLDPGTQGPPPPSSRAPQPTLEGHALPLQLWGLEQGGAWGAHTVWRSCWFPALYLPMRGSRPLKEGQAASMAPQGRMVGPRVQGFQAPISAVSSNYSLTLPSQRQLNWKFPLSPGPLSSTRVALSDMVSEELARPRVADVSGWPWLNGAWSPLLAFMRVIPARHQAKSCHSMTSSVAGTILQMREWRLRRGKVTQ